MAKMKLATLCSHTERVAKAKGLCGACYNKSRNYYERTPEAFMDIDLTRDPDLNLPQMKAEFDLNEHLGQYGLNSFTTQKIIKKIAQTQQGNELIRGIYNAVLEAQKGGCAICGKPPGTRRHAIDHCHQTGMLRGVLCTNCNLMLGLSRDSIFILSKAIAYLGRFGK